ncbi:MAG: DUF429 domain-containing protein [Elainellaceae cyanobacterium]
MTHPRRFIGIDLGWTSGESGLCCLEVLPGEPMRLRLVALTRRLAIADILTWVDQQAATAATVIAVDAPTLIPNDSGMRLPDRLAHRYFGRYHAGCYPANRGRPFAERTTGLGLALEERGYSHAPNVETACPEGNYQLEVFPHAAIIHLFQLPKILKYKKGRLDDRSEQLGRLRQLILTNLPLLSPALVLPELPQIPTSGRELKALEDQLDSLICAYTAAHWWYWGSARNLTLGNISSGYIVVPTPFGPLKDENP